MTTTNNKKPVQILAEPLIPFFDLNYDFPLDGVKVTLVYDDSSSEVITDGYTVTYEDSPQWGEHTVYVDYGGLTASFSLYGLVCYLTGIEISHAPKKMKYFLNEEFNPDGLVIEANFSGRVYLDVTDYVTYNKAITDDKITFTYCYNGQEASVDLNINFKNNITFNKDVSYNTDLEKSKMDTYIPVNKTNIPAVVLIHGGNWGGSKESFDVELPIFDYLLEQGFAVFNIDYRTIEDAVSGDGKTHCDDMLEDICNALNYIGDNYSGKVDLEKITLLGYSAGAHLAMLYAYKCFNQDKEQKRFNASIDINLVVTIAGPTLFIADDNSPITQAELCPEILKGILIEVFGSEDNFEKYSPCTYANENSPKTLALYGYGYNFGESEGEPLQYKETDGVVHIKHLEKLYYKLNQDNDSELYFIMSRTHDKLLDIKTTDNQFFYIALTKYITNYN